MEIFPNIYEEEENTVEAKLLHEVEIEFLDVRKQQHRYQKRKEYINVMCHNEVSDGFTTVLQVSNTAWSVE